MRQIQCADTKAPGKMTQLAAATAATLPVAVLTTWMYLVRDSAPTISEFFLGPLLFGGAMIFWLLFLHLVICHDTVRNLGFRIPGWGRDLLTGCLLGVGFLLIKHLTDPWFYSLFEPRQPAPEILMLIESVSSDPVLLALWLGPVVWIGVAGFEELWRVVVLRRFWAIFPGPWGQWLALLFVSAAIGLAHGYQGPASILSITMKSILMGWYFMTTGRARPLIVSHALYDSIQIVMAVNRL